VCLTKGKNRLSYYAAGRKPDKQALPLFFIYTQNLQKCSCFGFSAAQTTNSGSRLHLGQSSKKTLHIQDLQEIIQSFILSAMVKTEKLKIQTRGNCDVVDITEQVRKAVAKSKIINGTATLFNVGSTAGITTTEYEPGLVNYDIKAAFEKIAPKNARYEHEETWHDDNGHSHVRASVLGPSLAMPIVDRQLTLGTWQQIILVDFDTRPRTRTIICQIMGE
jgi:secondary thiamine-phosphate synthase enzyme